MVEILLRHSGPILSGNYLLVSLSFLFFTANVMFSHLSVILFTGGVSVQRGSLSGSEGISV